MKKLLLFTKIILLIQFTGFSQTATRPSDSVCIPLNQSVSILRDLTIADSMKVENQLLTGQVSDLKAAISYKDLQIKDCETSRDRLNLIITNYQALQTSDKATYKTLESAYKKEVRAGRFKVVLLVGLSALTGYFIFK